MIRPARIGIVIATVALAGLWQAGSAPASYPGANGRIAFVRSAPSDSGPPLTNIWTMRSDGSGQRQLTFTNLDDEPVWSPDGRRIAYRHLGDIWIMNADGSGRTQLTTYAGDDRDPTWSPDGRWILFSSARVTDYAAQLYKLRSTRPFGSAIAVTTVQQYRVDMFPAWGSSGQIARQQQVLLGPDRMPAADAALRRRPAGAAARSPGRRLRAPELGAQEQVDRSRAFHRRLHDQR